MAHGSFAVPQGHVDLGQSVVRLGVGTRAGGELAFTYLGDWIRQPSHFRPSTRMPQTFGLWSHLPAEQLRVRRATLLRELAERAAIAERRRGNRLPADRYNRFEAFAFVSGREQSRCRI